MSVSSKNPFARQLADLDRASPQFLDELTVLLSEEAIQDLELYLSAQETQWLADYLDDVRTPFPEKSPGL